MVEGVKQVRPELRVEAIVRTEVVVLGERQIGVGKPGIPHIGNRPRSVADCKLGQRRKHRSIEPFPVVLIAEFGAVAAPQRSFAVANRTGSPYSELIGLAVRFIQGER